MNLKLVNNLISLKSQLFVGASCIYFTFKFLAVLFPILFYFLFISFPFICSFNFNRLSNLGFNFIKGLFDIHYRVHNFLVSHECTSFFFGNWSNFLKGSWDLWKTHQSFDIILEVFNFRHNLFKISSSDWDSDFRSFFFNSRLGLEGDSLGSGNKGNGGEEFHCKRFE